MPIDQTATPVSPEKPKRNVDDYSSVLRDETPTWNMLNAFAAKPMNVCFDSQLKEEQVILLLRQHPVTQVNWVLMTIFALLLPFFIGPLGFLSFLPMKFQIASMVAWYMLVAGFVLESFLSWFFNAFIITDERIVDIDFVSLIYKNISAAKLDNIEDITATTGGAMRSIFDYGTITIQTAAANTQFEFADVPQTAKVTTLLNELLLEEERERIEGRVR